MKTLLKPHIKKFISQSLEKQKKSAGISTGRVIEELKRIALFDVRKIFDDDGKLIPVKDLAEDTARAVAGVEVTEMADGSIKTKIKTIDKSKALETLAKHLGMLVDRVSHEGNVGNVVIVIPDNNRDKQGVVVDDVRAK